MAEIYLYQIEDQTFRRDEKDWAFVALQLLFVAALLQSVFSQRTALGRRT